MMRIVCFIGIDGSGKTAHARELLSEIEKSGRKCKYVWFREPFFFSFPFICVCRVLRFSKIIRSANNYTYTQREYKTRPISIVWPWIRFVDLVIWMVGSVCIPAIFGFHVICDRFVHDILIDTIFDIGNAELPRTRIGQLMMKTVPQPSLIVLLDIDEQIAFKRKRDIPNVEYLVTRRKLYNLLASHLAIRTVNTDRPFPVVHKEVQALASSGA